MEYSLKLEKNNKASLGEAGVCTSSLIINMWAFEVSKAAHVKIVKLDEETTQAFTLVKSLRFCVLKAHIRNWENKVKAAHLASLGITVRLKATIKNSPHNY